MATIGAVGFQEYPGGLGAAQRALHVQTAYSGEKKPKMPDVGAVKAAEPKTPWGF